MDPDKKAKLGTRWSCFSCGGAFYDLNKPEPLCPRCGADQRESPVVEKPKKARRKKAARKKKAAINPALARDDEPSRPREADSSGVGELEVASEDEEIQVEVQED